MLRCSDGSYYIGHTDTLEKRIDEHNAGLGCKWTKTRTPVELVWSQQFPSRDEAKQTEAQLKKWSRAKKEALIQNRFDLVSKLAGRSVRDRAVRDAP